MHRTALSLAFILSLCFAAAQSHAEPGKGKLPHVEFDVEKKQVRVECEALNVNEPIEFFCCVTGTNEHEAILRTSAKPSDIQIGLLAMGLKPGRPLQYSEALNKWLPPQGPPLRLSVEFEKDGKTVNYPANRWLRRVKTKKSPELFSWVYTGSRVMGDGKFAADITGYVVSVVNFDLTLIDIPALASNDNGRLEWERNPDLMPKTGTKVWMIIEPVGGKEDPQPATAPVPKAQAPALGGSLQYAEALLLPVSLLVEGAPAPVAPTTSPSDPRISDVHTDDAHVKALQQLWEKKVGPNAKAMKQAAQAQYEVIAALRREQQRLIDEADRIQRTIDKLEKDYQDMTTPHAGQN